MLGRSVGFTLQDIAGRRLVVPGEAAELANVVNRLARRSTQHCGMTNVMDLAARASESAGTDTSESVVRQIVNMDDTFAWLDEAGGWLWTPSVPRNRLTNQIQKVLSVAERIRIPELRTAIGRHYRMNGFTPPRRVLRAFCDQLPGCRLDGDFVVADPPLDWQELLADIECTIVRVLKRSGPVMAGKELERQCLAEGVNRSSFWIYLGYSPVVARLARDVYGIPGADAPPGLVESLIPAYVRRRKVLHDFGWLRDGRIWLGYRLSEGSLSSGVLTVPTAMRDFLQGEFALKAGDDVPMGRFVSTGSSGWGIGPFFHRRGAEAGDYLLLLVDLKTRTAEARLGDEGLMDQVDADDDPSEVIDV